MVLLEFSMSPMDKGESVSPFVSRSLKIIDESGVNYFVCRFAFGDLTLNESGRSIKLFAERVMPELSGLV